MSKLLAFSLPPDQSARERALDPDRSILVQAPAGSGKTDLLTRRFLRLLAEVEGPGQVVAITFTTAAAAEMRHRILSELERAAEDSAPVSDAFSMASLAQRALAHSRRLGWQLLDLPAQLRISTIDAFCRELALQQPLLSGLGDGLDIAAHPDQLYRRAARATLRKIDPRRTDPAGSALGEAIEALLLWRDNNWQETENLLVAMLQSRDRWMHDFVLEREPGWESLRARLEQPFTRAVDDALTALSRQLDLCPGARAEALELARFACGQSGGALHRELAELAEFPSAPFAADADFEEAFQAHAGLAALLLTSDGAFRKQVDKRLGFPADRKKEKERILALIAALAAVPGLEAALATVRSLPPARYTEDDWRLVRACFTLLRHAAGELRIAFAEAGQVDFIEVAQIAQRVLQGDDGLPTDAALAIADGIHHLLVDEFQDTSRRQHQLLASLIAAWPEREGRTCFVVGDPMQSIYFFRDADAELFPRVQALGLEMPGPAPHADQPLRFDFVPLQSNFRTTPALVEQLNLAFARIFAADDGSGVRFAAAQPAREDAAHADPPLSLHLDFVLQHKRANSSLSPRAVELAENAPQDAHAAQIEQIVTLIRDYQDAVRQARARGEKFRIAILGRARKHLIPIARALREAAIPFRALDLEKLAARPEVLDALALGRALHNPHDRVAWLGVLRAPWCGLSLDDLHCIAGGDREALARPVSDLLAERLPLLSLSARPAAERVLAALPVAALLRSTQPTLSLGSWLEQVWLRLGGAACVDAAAHANLSLLWNCLDRLPDGAADLLGPALSTALDKLTALPDPGADGDCGVQLMTIHKAKGLEFEVVIVPELQAQGRRGQFKLLSWLERGLARPTPSGAITEFLIAPLPPKGVEQGSAKAWVDRVYRERETQEMRRVLYVAATRARQRLHLFARLHCKAKGESFALTEPVGCLLSTAWPALEEEVRSRCAAWNAARISRENNEGNRGAHEEEDSPILSIAAAAGEDNLLTISAPARPTLLRRLPPDFSFSTGPFEATDRAFQPKETSFAATTEDKDALYPRHQGGLLSRALGTAVHALLEELARLRTSLDWPAARAALDPFQARINAQVRAAGVDPSQAAKLAAQALHLARAASLDPIGAWILSPHRIALSEASWAGVVRGTVRTLRPDRVFLAGAAPGAEAPDAEEGACWWIVDYKTAHADNPDPGKILPELRARFAPQMEAYAQMLRCLHGANTEGRPLRAGLYYPRVQLLDWWEI